MLLKLQHIRFLVSENQQNKLIAGQKMNLLNNQNFKYLAYLALLTTLLAVLAKFDGIVSVQVTPLGLQVQVKSHSAECLIDPQLPNIEPKLLDLKFA
jgi:hypothetical protein